MSSPDPYEIEEALRRVFSKHEPLPGFAERVVARLPRRSPRRRVIISRSWMATAAAVLIAFAGTGTWHLQQEQRRREGEQVKAELVYALELTSEKLRSTRAKLLAHSGGNL